MYCNDQLDNPMSKAAVAPKLVSISRISIFNKKTETNDVLNL